MSNKSTTPPMLGPPRGILLVVSSPSGAGKTTLCQRLMTEFDSIDYSISFTTRPPRPGERQGVDYNFVAEDRFVEMVNQGLFAEWAMVHGHRYGTSRHTVEQNLSKGRDLLFDIDWQGALQLKAQYPQDVELVFVLPPSMQELARRLRGRGTDSSEVVSRRLAKAADEIRQYFEYHHLLVNDELERAYGDLRAIYQAAHLRQQRQAHRARALIEEVAGAADWPSED